MTFPTIPTSGAGRIISSTRASSSATLTSPDLSTLTKSSGDLLIAVYADYGASASNVWGSVGGSFTQFINYGSSGTSPVGVAWKVSDGTETGTFTVTQSGTVGGHAEMIVMAIPGAYTGAAPEFTANNTGTTSLGNPAALSPAAGAQDILWVAVGMSGCNSATGGYTGVGTAPTNYGNTFDVGLSAAAASNVMNLAVAFRQNNTASEDVGTWGSDTSNARNNSFVLAIRPAAPTGTATKTVTVSTASAGRLGLVAAAAKTITATATSAGVRGKLGASTKTITVAATSALSLGATGAATKTITVATTSAGVRGKVGGAAKTVTITATSAGTVSSSGGGGASKTVTVTTSSALRLGVSARAAKAITVTGTSAGVRGKVGATAATLTVAGLAGAALGANATGTAALTLTTVAAGSIHQPARDIKVLALVDVSRTVTLVDASRLIPMQEVPRTLTITEEVYE